MVGISSLLILVNAVHRKNGENVCFGTQRVIRAKTAPNAGSAGSWHVLSVELGLFQLSPEPLVGIFSPKTLWN
jgi:hypothetical protein